MDLSGGEKGAMRAKRKSSGQSPPTTGGVVCRHGDGVVKDEKDVELMTSSVAAVTSLKELELAAGKLDDVKARLIDPSLTYLHIYDLSYTALVVSA